MWEEGLSECVRTTGKQALHRDHKRCVIWLQVLSVWVPWILFLRSFYSPGPPVPQCRPTPVGVPGTVGNPSLVTTKAIPHSCSSSLLVFISQPSPSFSSDSWKYLALPSADLLFFVLTRFFQKTVWSKSHSLSSEYLLRVYDTWGFFSRMRGGRDNENKYAHVDLIV